MGRAVIYMLDTNTCIYIINQRPPQVRAHFEGLHYGAVVVSSRSEERRVGKECRSRWSPYH